MFVVTTSVGSCPVRSNDLSRYRVTWLMPSNAHRRRSHQSPSRQTVDPGIARVMASAITLLATTEVVTTNKKAAAK
ncbi:MAG: hypothetical protein ACRC8Y_02575 [Chroococcales cyanobacterium]